MRVGQSHLGTNLLDTERAMARQNVEVMKAGFVAWNAGDMEAVRELFHSDVIMQTPEGWPEPGPLVGREAVMRQFEQLRATWDADTAEPVGDFVVADDRVAVRMIWRGVGHGPDSSMEWTYVATFRDGRVSGVEYFWDHAEALAALGLRERDADG